MSGEEQLYCGTQDINVSVCLSSPLGYSRKNGATYIHTQNKLLIIVAAMKVSFPV